MDCFECLSLLVAIPFTVAVTRSPLAWLLVWPALSGAACPLDRLGTKYATLPIQPLKFPENHDDVVSRPKRSDAEC